MRDSIADLEKLLLAMQKETNYDLTFLNGLLSHKNATIGWFRDQQRTAVEAMDAIFERILTQQKEESIAVIKIYEDMIDTLSKEVDLLEKHLASYEKPTV